MGDFVVGYWPEVGIIVVHTLVRLRRSPNGSKALEARLKGRVFRRNVPLKWVTEARLTAIQRVWFFGSKASFSGQPDRRAHESSNRNTWATGTGFESDKPNQSTHQLEKPEPRACVSGLPAWSLPIKAKVSPGLSSHPKNPTFTAP